MQFTSNDDSLIDSAARFLSMLFVDDCFEKLIRAVVDDHGHSLLVINLINDEIQKNDSHNGSTIKVNIACPNAE